ncbi:hypothetical protein HF086_008678 [Spodoptera exigua]|uniref:Uncharacterized protein n=1 Tax=Spodoptera exigua TaxID=7107 RepID=A0A922MWL1_SPOEX|nr:hypothetical protein HF086_008678 [Spodoptera exigua]
MVGVAELAIMHSITCSEDRESNLEASSDQTLSPLLVKSDLCLATSTWAVMQSGGSPAPQKYELHDLIAK